YGRYQEETEFPMSHMNDVAVDQRDLVDSLAVGEGSIGAGEITHQVPTGVLSDEGVVFGDLLGVDREVGCWGSPDDEGVLGDLHPFGRTALFREMFQIGSHAYPHPVGGFNRPQ